MLPLVAASECGRPKCIPSRRARGVKALGVRYENRVAKAMSWARQGVWFEFLDGLGRAWCQPDLIWDQGEFVVVGEVKHSWVEEAQVKLSGLYLPVVAKAFGKPARGLVVCKNLKPQVRNSYTKLASAMALLEASPQTIPTLHWIGQGTIVNPLNDGPILARRFGHGQIERRA